MSELGEFYKGLRVVRQNKKAANRENSARLLDEAGIVFIPKNNGAHLIVEGKECYIDFWPGTGKWISRNGVKGFGVRNLIAFAGGLPV